MSQSPHTPLYRSTSTATTTSLPFASNESSSIATPSSLFETPSTINNPAAPTLAVEALGIWPRDSDTQTPESIVAQSEAYDEIVESIMELPPDEWFAEGQAAVYDEQSRSQKGAEILQGKFVEAFEIASTAQFLHAEILRDSSLDPDTYFFSVFKTWSLAKILYKQPDMALKLKIEVTNKSSNAGYTKVCKWIDSVAKDVMGTIEKISDLCVQDKYYGLGDGVRMRDTLTAMDYYFEYYYEHLCYIYPEYKNVPKMAPEEELNLFANGIPAGNRF